MVADMQPARLARGAQRCFRAGQKRIGFLKARVLERDRVRVHREVMKMAKAKEPTTIKKYANRRLYNTGTSTYVTLEDLSIMVRSGEDFVVFDAKTNEDITRQVLTQIIFEQENKGQNL